MEKLIVLSDLRVADSKDPFSAGVRGWPPRFSGPPEPMVDVIAADAADLDDIQATPGVIAVGAVVPTRLISPTSVHETGRATSWGIEAIGADRSAFDGSGVTVAILDTGIDRHHPAFAGVALLEEDFTATANGDRNDHGTHCAGTVLGRDLAGSRIGIARGVTNALIGKILRDDGSGTSEMIVRGIAWADERGANVISMSVGLDFPGHVARLVSDGWPPDLATSRALEAYRANLRLFDALMAMLRARVEFGTGCVVVAAAGNESRRDVRADYTIASSLPAAAHGVLSVAAVEDLGPDGLGVATFSNTLPTVAAPGVDIISARPGLGTSTMSGTSMSCPHVAGTAALWWQSVGDTRRRVSARIVEAKLLASARTDRLPHGASVADVGAGVVMTPSIAGC